MSGSVRGVGGGAFSRGMSRGRFLKLGGVGLAGATLLGTAGCGGGGAQQGGPVNLVFAHTPDPSDTFQAQVDAFNQQHQGEIQVEVRQMPPDSGQYFDQLRTEFQAGASEIDVFEGDVIWPAQFAANGWLSDLSDRFTEDMQTEHLEGAVQSNIYEGAIYGMPWRTDAGLLYYRQDLLDDSGISEPPATWDELREMAQQVAQESNTEFGYVFQGANYEGGVVNALEYIWTHGGDVLAGDDASQIVIDSPESVSGLQTQRSMVADGITPQAVVNYLEDESSAAFLRGDAVFSRHWPYVYASLGDPEQSEVEPEQVGIAPLPVASEGDQSFSGLGGWNLFINASSENQEAAWEFIQFMNDPEQQRTRAIDGTYLPTLNSLYEDQEILDEVPVIDLGREAIQNARSRPVSPVYSDMSLEMAEQFNDSLNGDVSPEEAISALQRSLQEIVDQAS